jgi:hypothetical protein
MAELWQVPLVWLRTMIESGRSTAGERKGPHPLA